VREIAAELGHGITSNAVIAKSIASASLVCRLTAGDLAAAAPASRVLAIGACTGIASGIGSAKARRRPGS